MKRLYKSKDNKVITGVIGGIGEYFNIDPVLLRLAWLLVMIFTAFAPAIIVYIVATMVVPHRPLKTSDEDKKSR